MAAVQHSSSRDAALFPNDWTSVKDIALKLQREKEAAEALRVQELTEQQKEAKLIELDSKTKQLEAEVKTLRVGAAFSGQQYLG